MSGRKAGKGPLVQEEMSATLGISQDQYLFQPIAFDGYNQAVTRGGYNMDNDNRKELRDIGSDGSGGQSEGLERPTDSGDAQYIVRRLTPTECAALQGFPKDWCADVPHSDSAEYKLWGNGIALPSILGIVQNAVMKVERLRNE